MLAKTVAALKADKHKTLDLINGVKAGSDRDLYPFCSNVSDGKTVALGNPNARQLIGVDVRTLKDAAGKAVWPGTLRRVSEAGRFATNFTLGPNVSFRRKAEDLLEGDARATVAAIRRPATPFSPSERSRWQGNT